MSHTFVDRRRSPRNKKLLSVSCFQAEVRRNATTVDISQHGAFVNTSYKPPLGSTLEVSVRDKLTEVTVVGRVVRHVDVRSRISAIPGLGLAWIKVDAPRLSLLRRFLTEVLDIAAGDIDAEYLRGAGSSLSYYIERGALFGLVRPATDGGEAGLPVIVDTSGPSNATFRDRRKVERFTIHTEAVLYCDGVPLAVYLRDLSLHGALFTTFQSPPAVGQRVTCRSHLTGPFADHWLRLGGVVARRSSDPETGENAFAVQIDVVDECGCDGIFVQYLDYLRQLGRIGERPPHRMRLA